MDIHRYAETGNIRAVAKEIAQGVDIDSRDEEYPCTPLSYAVWSDRAELEMIRFLIKKGADVNARGIGKSQCAVFSFAVRGGDLEKIQFLLDAGADINYQGAYNSSALVEAVRSNYDNLVEVLQLLIDRGCKTDKDYIALQIAARIGRFDAVRVLIEAGVDRASLQWTPLMNAIALGTTEDVKVLLDNSADLAARDYELRTPFLLSLAVGDLAKAKLLFSSGAKISDRGKQGETSLMLAICKNQKRIEILKWLLEIGCDPKTTQESGMTALHYAVCNHALNCVALLLKNGANPNTRDKYDSVPVASALTMAMARILIDAGASLSQIDDELRQQLTGIYHQELLTTKQDYLLGRYRQFGLSNPEVMKVNFWSAMIRSNCSAWKARDKYSDRNSSQAVWSYQRFGRTITELPNGKIIEIGGEHEDSYDEDFCIYNDVVVYQSNDCFQIFGYPQQVFPPTDFHTANLVEEYIYIIGNLGYGSDRIVGETPVYRLNWHNLKMEQIETTGNKPGWISRHVALYQTPNQIVVSQGKVWQKTEERFEYLDNHRSFSLDLNSLCWIEVPHNSI